VLDGPSLLDEQPVTARTIATAAHVVIFVIVLVSAVERAP
jgi:hypothetical protein